MRSKETREDDAPRMSLEYGYMGETVNMRDEGPACPVLCCKCSHTKVFMPAALSSKGVTEWTVNHAVDFVNGLTHCKVVIKADR